MNRLFASYLAEELPYAEITGSYDPERQLWIGAPLPLASNGTGDGDGDGATAYWTGGGSSTQYTTINDLGYAPDPDTDTTYDYD